MPLRLVRSSSPSPSPLPPAQTSVQKRTSAPVWCETLRATAWLPPLNLAPDLVVSVWDEDVGVVVSSGADDDDFVGMCRVPLRNSVQPASASAENPPPPRPEWRQLRPSGLTGGGGEILLSTELLRLETLKPLPVGAPRLPEIDPALLSDPETLPNLAPATRPCSLKLAVIGLRGVTIPRHVVEARFRRSGIGATPNRPFVEVSAGARHSARTPGSNLPSSINPTYQGGGLLRLPLDLPLDPLFMPQVNVRVCDTLFGGLRTPELGVTTIPISHLLPNAASVERASAADGGGDGGGSGGGGGAAEVVQVETYENERWYVDGQANLGFCGRMLPSDPPHWSSADPPFVSLPRLPREQEAAGPFALPTSEWRWTSEWHVDPQPIRDGLADEEGWSYSLYWGQDSSPHFSAYDLGDCVRRRRWVRTRERDRPREEEAPTPTGAVAAPAASTASATSGDVRIDIPHELTAAEDPAAASVMARVRRGTAALVSAALLLSPTEEERAERGGLSTSGGLSIEERCDLIKKKLEQAKEQERTIPVAAVATLWNRAVGRVGGRHLRHVTDKLKLKNRVKELQLQLEAAKQELHGESTPKYMLTPSGGLRETYKHPLEQDLTSPFGTFDVMSGEEGAQVKVCTLKALVRLSAGSSAAPTEASASASFADSEHSLLEAIMAPKEFVVRVYVLEAKGLISHDADSPSDPYLRVSLGETHLDCRREYLEDEPDPQFHRMFELEARLPGDSLLTIDVYDHAGGLTSRFASSDDLIGSTTIDLEDRLFSERWQKEMAACPPIEWRPLTTPYQKREQGQLKLWVDLIPAALAAKTPPLDISLAPSQEWELRVIVWSGIDLPAYDVDATGLADWYVTCSFAQSPAQQTDTHFRAKHGKASWNWRFKFPVTLKARMKYQRLRLQLWDKDITADDCGAEAVLDLTSPWLERMFKRRRPRPTYWEPFDDPRNHNVAERWKIRSAKETSSFQSSLREVAEELMAKESLLGAEGDDELESAKFWLPMQKPHREEAADDEAGDGDEEGGGGGGGGGGGVSSFLRRRVPLVGPCLGFMWALLWRILLAILSCLCPAGDDESSRNSTSGTRHTGKGPKLLVSVQLVPKADVEKLPAGFGRSSPNSNPALPKPTGRLAFTLNPFRLMYDLLGPRLCAKIGGALCCVVCLLLAWYLTPVIIGNVITEVTIG